MEKRKLLIAVNCVAALAIFFFGYDQGMMGSVNVSLDYGHYRMGFGDIVDGNLVVQNSLLQGGIVGYSQPEDLASLTDPGLGVLFGNSSRMPTRRLDW